MTELRMYYMFILNMISQTLNSQHVVLPGNVVNNM